jgi:hypothetical protein
MRTVQHTVGLFVKMLSGESSGRRSMDAVAAPTAPTMKRHADYDISTTFPRVPGKMVDQVMEAPKKLIPRRAVRFLLRQCQIYSTRPFLYLNPKLTYGSLESC